MRISVRADGADGVTESSSSCRFFLSERLGKQFRIWNYVTKVFSTEPLYGLNMNDLSRVWPMSHEALLSTGGRHSPGAMQPLAVHARIQKDGRFSTFAPKMVEKRIVEVQVHR
jgi:hypothetical protein